MIDRSGFVRAVLFTGAAFATLFAGEALFELWRADWPGSEATSWVGVNNAKLVDILSPFARAYNNILAMLLATIGLAIPLTANMHTPKLIEMFLRDRLNRVVLFVFAAGAANVLYVDYLIGPEFAPTWAIHIAVYGALFGWILLIPYFYYVVRFLDPSKILARLSEETLAVIDRARRGRVDPDEAQDVVHERLHQIGTIVFKSLDRGDRGVALEGIWLLKRIVGYYGGQKPEMPQRLFEVDRRDFVGLSAEALDIINEERTWLEMKALGQLRLIYHHALGKANDVVSAVSDATRLIAVEAEGRGDLNAAELCVRQFNTYLREAISARRPHAVYDIFYQYRLLAKEVRARPELLRDIVFYFRYYAEGARKAGLIFVWEIAAFDMAFIVRRAFEIDCDVRDELLEAVLAIDHAPDGQVDRWVVEAKIVLGAFFLERGLSAEAVRVRERLADVPTAELVEAERAMLHADRVFFEITDRQIDFEWVAEERRPHVSAFVRGLVEGRPSSPGAASPVGAPLE